MFVKIKHLLISNHTGSLANRADDGVRPGHAVALSVSAGTAPPPGGQRQ